MNKEELEKSLELFTQLMEGGNAFLELVQSIGQGLESYQEGMEEDVLNQVKDLYADLIDVTGEIASIFDDIPSSLSG